MEEFFPFLKNSIYVKSKRIKSIRLFLKILNEPLMPNEVLMYNVLFNTNGRPKQITSHDMEGNVHELSVYNSTGQIVKKTINHNNTATHQMPVIDTISYEYKNNLLIRETEVSESKYFGMYEIETTYIREYEYDSHSRIIAKNETYLIDNIKRTTKFEYPTTEIIREIAYDDDGRINYVIISRFDMQGFIIEKRTLNSYQFEENSMSDQIFRQTYLYNNDNIKEMQSYDKISKINHHTLFHYNDKGYLVRVDSSKNSLPVYAIRYDYKMFGLLNFNLIKLVILIFPIFKSYCSLA
jgi:hypothetical protein